jgi:hypothetical protein
MASGGSTRASGEFHEIEEFTEQHRVMGVAGGAQLADDVSCA